MLGNLDESMWKNFRILANYLPCDNATLEQGLILVVYWSIFKLVFFYIISFLQVHNTLHKRMIQVELYLRISTAM